MIGLSDAALASDALDSELSERLGEAPGQPEMLGTMPGTPGAGAPRRAHRAKATQRATAKTVTAAELVKPLEGSLGLLTLGLGLLICGFNLEDPVVEIVTMDADEAKAVATPLANILVRQKWFREYGQHLVNSDDAIALTYALIVYAGRVTPAIRERTGARPRRDRHQQTARVSAGPGNQAGAGDASRNGYAAGGYGALSGAYTAD